MWTKLSLLVSAVLATGEVAPEVENLDLDDFDDEGGEYEGGDDFDAFSLGGILDQFKGENNENAEVVEQLKTLLFSGDESEENSKKIQLLFEQLLGKSPSVNDDDAEL